jgi:tripartite-type tricarboxylate transporter receptor subunit TctC
MKVSSAFRPIAALLLCGLAGFHSFAAAQSYPAKPVHMIVPYAAGGAVDIVTRMVATRLAADLGQPFVVENRPSAGGVAAASVVAKAPADGYTLLTADIQQMAITPFLFANLPFNVATDFAPVNLMISMPLFLMVKPGDKLDSLKELSSSAASRPITYATPGIGSIHHIAMESFKSAARFDMTHVPYKGAALVITGFLAGDVSIAVATYGAVAPQVAAGKGKLLAATTLKRTPLAPDVPTISEIVPGFDYSSEIGIMAPAGTSPEIVARLSKVILAALREPENVKKLAAMGADVVGSGPVEYAENLRRNREKFATAVKLSGAKVE